MASLPLVLLAGVLAVGQARAALPPNCAQSASTVTCTFSSTGAEQVFSVPAGTTRVRIKAVGAPGGAGAQGETGGAGAVASGTPSVTVAETLYIEVGGAGGQAFAGGGPGFNGGGTGNREAGGGGGGSDVRTAPMSAGLTPDTRVLIAGAPPPTPTPARPRNIKLPAPLAAAGRTQPKVEALGEPGG